MTYELYILLDPKYSQDELTNRMNELVAAFGQQGVQLSLVKKEVGKSLAYPIGKRHKAHALLFTATSEPGVDIEKVAKENLNPQEDVLRRLIFRAAPAESRESRIETPSTKHSKKDEPAEAEQSTTDTQVSAQARETDAREIDKKIEELLQ